MRGPLARRVRRWTGAVPRVVTCVLALAPCGPAAVAWATAPAGPGVLTPDGWSVRRVAATATPWNVRLAAPERLPGWDRDHEAALRDFFDRHAATFRLRPGADGMRLTRETSLPGTHHARLQQTFRGLPVLGADCTVSLGPDGDVRDVLGTFVPGVAVETVPRLTGEAAAAAALAGLPGAPADYGTTARLAIRRNRSGDHLVYEVVATARRRPLSWRVLVDARDGTTLARTDLVLRVTGSGCMVRLHPDTLSLESVPFPRLCCDGTGLRGDLLEVHNGDPVANPNAYSPTSTFCYAPLEPDTNDFDQANVYWHIDHLLGDFLRALDYPGPAAPFHVEVQPGELPGATAGMATLADGAAAIWYGSIQRTLKDGTRVVRNGAREASIVYHEAAHGVLLDLGITPGEEDEAAVVHEGLADYFACATTGIPAQGTWTYGAGTRTDTDPAVCNYANDGIRNGDSHIAGQILSGALWDMRTDPAMGTVTDRVVLRSLYYLPAHPSFAMVAAAVFNADCEIRSGADTAAIRRALNARGIPMGDLSLGPLTLNGPGTIGSLGPSACGRWTARPVQGLRPYHYKWWKLTDCVNGACTWTPAGSDSAATICGSAGFGVQLLLTDARGVIAWAYRDVAVTAPAAIALSGPSTLETSAGRAVCGAWTAAIPTGYRPYRYEWRRYDCVDGACAWTSIGSDSAVTACGASSFDLQFLLADALGNITGGTRHVAVVDTTAPLLAAIGGPDTLETAPDLAVCGTWRAVSSGGYPPYSLAWRRYSSASRIWSLVGSDSVVTECETGKDIRLWLALTDARQSTANVFRTIAVVDTSPPAAPLAVTLGGPAQLGANVAGAFTAVASGGDTSRTFRWVKYFANRPTEEVGQACEDTPRDTCFAEVSDDTRFTLQVSVSAGDTTVSATQVVDIVLTPLHATLRGEESLELGVVGSYAVEATGGCPPYRYLWEATDCQGATNSTLQDTGDFEVGAEMANCDCGAIALRVTVTDAGAGTVTDTLRVGVTCAGTSLSFVRTGGGAGAATPTPVTFAVWAPEAVSADLAIYDLGGRRLAALHHGELPGGYRAFAWNASGAPSGVYFARLLTPGRSLTRRVVLVR